MNNDLACQIASIANTIPTDDPQDPGFDVQINYISTRTPTASEPLTYNNYPFLMTWWQQANSSDSWATYNTNDFWLCVNNTVDSMVWWKVVFDANILQVINSVGWQINTARNYAASGISLNTARQPSLTNDIFVAASVNLVNILATSTTVIAEISPDNSTWTTVGQADNTTGIVSNTTQMLSFVVPQGYYYRLIASGSGTVNLTRCQELSF